MCEFFPRKADGKAQPQPQPQPQPLERPKANEFYFDKDKGTWIINGREADSEYDMGQEPIVPKSKADDVVPPPEATAAVQRSPEKIAAAATYEEVPPMEAEVIKKPFGQPQQVKTGPVAKKKSTMRSLYVPQ